MNWKTTLIIAVILIVFFLLKKAGQISAKDAQELLKNGALVIDVRSPGEFGSGHVKQALNIPLDQIESILPRQVKDKNQVLLLHCQSGMRSAAAMKKIKTLGYPNTHNLGSLSRAKQIAEGAAGQ